MQQSSAATAVTVDNDPVSNLVELETRSRLKSEFTVFLETMAADSAKNLKAPQLDRLEATQPNLTIQSPSKSRVRVVHRQIPDQPVEVSDNRLEFPPNNVAEEDHNESQKNIKSSLSESLGEVSSQ